MSDTTTPRAHHPAKCPKCAHPVLIYSDATTLILSVRQHTGIAEAGSLARYARHVPGISSATGALRARWRAETGP